MVSSSRRAFLQLLAYAGWAGQSGIAGEGRGAEVTSGLDLTARAASDWLKNIQIIAVHPYGEALQAPAWPGFLRRYSVQLMDRAPVLDCTGPVVSGESALADLLGSGVSTASFSSYLPLEDPAAGVGFKSDYYHHLPLSERWKNPDGSVADDPYECAGARNILSVVTRAYFLETNSSVHRTIMSQASPYWREFQKRSISFAVSRGMDAINVDLMGSSVFSDSKGWDFSEWSQRAFRSYLRSKYAASVLAGWGVQNVDTLDMRAYILDRWVGRGPSQEKYSDGEPLYLVTPFDGPLTDRVVRAFHKFHYQTHIDFHREVAAHAHAAVGPHGAQVAYYGNLVIGFPNALLFAPNSKVVLGQVVDVIAIETRSPVPPSERLTAMYKLARAMGSDAKPVWSIHAPPYDGTGGPAIPANNSTITLSQIYIADAYAAGAVPELDFGGWPGMPPTKGLVPTSGPGATELVRYTDFVDRNRELLAGASPLSRVALIYSIPTFLWTEVPLIGIWPQHEQACFIGFARAMEDALIQYDVKIFGHPEFWDDSKALSSLSAYSAVVLPRVWCLSDDQVAALVKYVRSGGKVLLINWSTAGDKTEDYVARQTPALAALQSDPGRGQLTYLLPDQVKAYYDKVVKAGGVDSGALAGLTSPLLGDREIQVGATSQRIGLSAWQQPGRAILHFVNYEYNLNDDTIQPVPELKVTLDIGRWTPGSPHRVLWLTPDSDAARNLPFQVVGRSLAFSTAGLRVWGIALVSFPVGAVALSSASYFNGPIAPDSLISVFGQDLSAGSASAGGLPLPTSLASVTVTLTDSAGQQALCPLIFVSQKQINCLTPPNLRSGPASLVVDWEGRVAGQGSVEIADVAPGLFTAASTGTGAAAAVVIRVLAGGAQITEPVVQWDASAQAFRLVPIAVGSGEEQAILVLFGTGIRGAGRRPSVQVTIGGEAAPVLYSGLQGGFAGLDQVNVQIPKTLRGRGEADVQLTADGKRANAVTIRIA